VPPTRLTDAKWDYGFASRAIVALMIASRDGIESVIAFE
jgi:hypothetical protein